jgi:hypothetical protein
MIELTILKYFAGSKEMHDKYYNHIKDISTEKEIEVLLKTIDKYYKQYDHHEFMSIDELEIYFNHTYPAIGSKETYTQLFKRIKDLETSDSLAKSVVAQFIEKGTATKMVDKLLPILRGEDSNVMTAIATMVEEYRETVDDNINTADDLYVKDLDDLAALADTGDGLSWGLDCLNRDIGPLCGGSLGHVFARPDTGKTTFIIAQLTAFKDNLKADECLLWVNNEEKPSKLLTRLYNSVCGVVRQALFANTEFYKKKFIADNGNAIKLIDRATVSIYDLEGWIRTHNPRIVVIDQGDKVTYSGGKDKAQHDRLTDLYGKFRELAKAYDIDIISVGQAGAEAHGQKWPQLTHMNNSKTGKPGELDYAIGIGKEEKETDNYVRYLHFCKNKMEDGVHGKHTVLMNPTLCTYTDI